MLISEVLTQSLIESLATELEAEAVTTRRVLERVSEARLDWRPHPKSFSLGQLALHIAGVPPGIARMAEQDRVEVPDFTQTAPATVTEVLEAFDAGILEALETLRRHDDAWLGAPWHVVRNGEVVLSLPRAHLIRGFLLNQLYHHRGQLTVYLRQLDLPLPPIYGPTADEPAF